MVNMSDIVVGATCATVRSTHAHKIDRLRLVRVWHLFVSSSLKRLNNPRGTLQHSRMWRSNLAEDRLSEQIRTRALNFKSFGVPVGLVNLELCWRPV